MPGIARILSIDGGGIRGMIPAVVLQHLEARLGQPIAGAFHMLAGTSTGGVLTTGLSRPDPIPAGKLVELYRTRGRDIFDRSPWKSFTSLGGVIDERYGSDGLRRVLAELLGEARLSDVGHDLLVTAYEIERREPFFFKSWKAHGRHLGPDETAAARDYLLRDAAHATSAAPSLFEPAVVRSAAGETACLIDGGTFANNPAMCALASARRIYPGADGFLIVSLGTGRLKRPIRYEDARGWGAVGWLRPLLSVLFEGLSSTVHYQLVEEMGEGDGYVRLQASLGPGSDGACPNDELDDASEGNVAALHTRAETLARVEDRTLDQLVARLAQSKAPLAGFDAKLVS